MEEGRAVATPTQGPGGFSGDVYSISRVCGCLFPHPRQRSGGLGNMLVALVAPEEGLGSEVRVEGEFPCLA